LELTSDTSIGGLPLGLSYQHEGDSPTYHL